MSARPRLLLIDDGESYARAFSRLADVELIDPGAADGIPRLADGPAALAWLERHRDRVDVVLLDMRFDVDADRLLPLPGGPASLRRQRRFQGVAILGAIRERFPDLPVVVLTAVEDLSLLDAGEELAQQSLTYMLDGEDLDAVRIRVHTALAESRRAQEEADILWGQDAAMGTVRRRLAVLARGRLPVILEGETGTGKSFLAERWLHARSGRPGPFVVLDLATIPTDLVPAHLFGATRGAYTGAVTDRKGVFELAHEGTLFIDEIQNVPLEVQKQLLLVLQDRKVRPLGSSREVPVDVKVVAASNTPLADAVRAGRFRPDLHMRLSPATRVQLPPLRERPRDLAFLARRFVSQAVRDSDIDALRAQVAGVVGLPPTAPLRLVVGREGRTDEDALQIALPRPAWARLEAHPWPGNLRELSMVMHNILTFTLVGAVDAIGVGLELHSPRLQVDPGLVADLLSGASTPEPTATHDPDVFPVRLQPAATLNAVSAEAERQYLIALFHQTDGDFGAMAERLLGDAERARAVRLRFNQLGLKVRELRKA
ncbi:MAG: sigma-54-dependent Fis family transcriptional regulator [Myxococcales bacterium]|nr:sigma-54-dependent Fis family transcriptional regulator [Myxococcales bacterium]